MKFPDIGWREHLKIAQSVDPLLQKIQVAETEDEQQLVTCELYEFVLSVLLPDTDWATVSLDELIKAGKPGVEHLRLTENTAKKNGKPLKRTRRRLSSASSG